MAPINETWHHGPTWIIFPFYTFKKINQKYTKKPYFVWPCSFVHNVSKSVVTFVLLLNSKLQLKNPPCSTKYCTSKHVYPGPFLFVTFTSQIFHHGTKLVPRRLDIQPRSESGGQRRWRQHHGRDLGRVSLEPDSPYFIHSITTSYEDRAILSYNQIWTLPESGKIFFSHVAPSYRSL